MTQQNVGPASTSSLFKQPSNPYTEYHESGSDSSTSTMSNEALKQDTLLRNLKSLSNSASERSTRIAHVRDLEHRIDSVDQQPQKSAAQDNEMKDTVVAIHVLAGLLAVVCLLIVFFMSLISESPLCSSGWYTFALAYLAIATTSTATAIVRSEMKTEVHFQAFLPYVLAVVFALLWAIFAQQCKNAEKCD